MHTPSGTLFRTLRPFLLTALCGVLLLLPLGLYRQQPPQQPQLTLFNTDGGLSLLLEGAGGGRILIGGGASLAELPATLGRYATPLDRPIDLLIVADRRDLPGAPELVHRDVVRAVATVGLVAQREASAGLAALAAACAARTIPLRAIESGEVIAIGHAPPLTLTIHPPADLAAPPRLHLRSGPFDAPILLGPTTDDTASLGAILPRANQETYALALATDARLLIAPAPPTTLPDLVSPGRYLLHLAPGERATLRIDGDTLRLRGPRLVPLDADSEQR